METTFTDALAFSTEVVEAIKIGFREVLPSGVFGLEVDAHADYMRDHIAASVTAFVYGRTGPTATAEKTYYEAKLPRWIPRRLRNRWTRRRTIAVDATPLLLWPDSTFAPPEFGNATRIMRVHRRDE